MKLVQREWRETESDINDDVSLNIMGGVVA